METHRWPSSASRDKFEEQLLKLEELENELKQYIRNRPHSIYPPDNSEPIFQNLIRHIREMLNSRESELRDHLDRAESSSDYGEFDRLSSRAVFINSKLIGLCSQGTSSLEGRDLKYRIDTLTVSMKSRDAEKLLTKILDKILEIKSLRASTLPENLHLRTTNSTGIVTVLEHEYQSVVRRLDHVLYTTDEDSYGFGILKRDNDGQDLKEINERLYADQKFSAERTGWTLGFRQKRLIVVICTGFAGDQVVEKCIEHFSKIQPEIKKMAGFEFTPPSQWFVVGVCAGVKDTWGLGTVLVANETIIQTRVTHASTKWMVVRSAMANNLISSNTRFTPHQLHRPIPEDPCSESKVERTIFSANPVKFICSSVVIDTERARDAVIELVMREGYIAENDDIGIEMEGAGIFDFRGYNPSVVKATCDYADERKSQWSEESKNRLQLYAAELAAEFFFQQLNSDSS